MADELKKGDDVTWNTPQGTTEGTVQEKLTEDTKISGHQVRADDDDPQYLVESDKTGKQAAHKPGALDKK